MCSCWWWTFSWSPGLDAHKGKLLCNNHLRLGVKISNFQVITNQVQKETKTLQPTLDMNEIMFIQFMRLTNCHSLIFYSNLFTCTLPQNPPLKFSILLCLTVVARVNNSMNLLNGQPFSLYLFLLFASKTQMLEFISLFCLIQIQTHRDLMLPFQLCLQSGLYPAAATISYPTLTFTPHLFSFRRNY